MATPDMTPAERIRELSDINTDVAAMLGSAGRAINALTNRPLNASDEDAQMTDDASNPKYVLLPSHFSPEYVDSLYRGSGSTIDLTMMIAASRGLHSLVTIVRVTYLTQVRYRTISRRVQHGR